MFSVPVPCHSCIRDTVHKAQGIAVPRAVLNITDREFSTRLQYVAISRVKTLDGILFEEPFDYEQMVNRHTSPIVRMRNGDYDRCRGQHMEEPLCA